MTTLISITDLISQSWTFFCTNWKPLLKRASWFLLLLVAYMLVAGYASVRQMWGLYSISVIAYIIGAVVAMNHIYLYLLKTDRPSNSPLLERRAIDLIPQMIWIVLLTSIAVMLGGILLILPAIWLGIAFGFAPLAFLDENIQGTDAMRRSYRLVKGRWWATFWRGLLPGLLIGVIIWLLSIFLWIIIGLIAGGGIFAILTMLNGATSTSANLAGGIGGITLAVIALLIGIVVQIGLGFIAIMYPLINRVKMYHSLKDTFVTSVTK